MNRYIQIIREALQQAESNQAYWEEISEETILRIIAAIDLAMSFISQNYVDQREYDEFMFKIQPYKGEPDVHHMLDKLEKYHRDSLIACEKEPNWKKFDNGLDSGRSG